MLAPEPTLFLFYLFKSPRDLPRSRPDNTFIFFRNKSVSCGSCGPLRAQWPLRWLQRELQGGGVRLNASQWHPAHSLPSLSSSMRISMTAVLSLWPLYHFTSGTLILSARHWRFLNRYFKGIVHPKFAKSSFIYTSLLISLTFFASSVEHFCVTFVKYLLHIWLDLVTF